MLRQPIPLTSTYEIGAKSEEIINPWPFRGGSVVGIMLDIQTDESLGDSEHDSNECTTIKPASRICEGSIGCELILHEEKERNVGNGTGEECGGAIFTPSAHNLKDFVFYLTFERSVKFVPDWNSGRDEDCTSNNKITRSENSTYSGS